MCVDHAAQSPTQCGTGGAACATCSNDVCDTTTGTCSCNSNTCQSGCCNGGTTGPCVDYVSQSAGICGASGASCGSCGGGTCNTHSDGLGQSWKDCSPVGTYTPIEAIAGLHGVCDLVGQTGAECSDGWACTGDPVNNVCFANSSLTTCVSYCWGYAGGESSFVYTCSCPDTKAGVSWQ